jgi:hypothetical protein
MRGATKTSGLLMSALCFRAVLLPAQPIAASIVTHGLLIAGPSVIDAAGNTYTTGGAPATNFPVTPGAAQTQPGGGMCPIYGPFPLSEPCPDVYIAKVDPSGNTVFATLLGGLQADNGVALAVDSSGNVYVTGTTGGSFPTTPGAAIPSSAGGSFVAKRNAGRFFRRFALAARDGLLRPACPPTSSARQRSAAVARYRPAN